MGQICRLVIDNAIFSRPSSLTQMAANIDVSVPYSPVPWQYHLSLSVDQKCIHQQMHLFYGMCQTLPLVRQEMFLRSKFFYDPICFHSFLQSATTWVFLRLRALWNYRSFALEEYNHFDDDQRIRWRQEGWWKSHPYQRSFVLCKNCSPCCCFALSVKSGSEWSCEYARKWCS